MKSFWCLLFLCHCALGGNLYSPTSYAFPASNLVAQQPISPLHYSSPLRTSVGYGPLAAARVGHVTASLLAPTHLAAAPAAAVYAAPAPAVVARYSAPTAYAAPIAPVPVLQKYAAVPAVAHVPITRYEARPGFIQKYVDVAHPKVATTKIQIRRPAIQKQFYDIEERIIIRPIASAVVELDQPLSKSQSGPTVISPSLPTAPGVIPVVAAQLPSAPTYVPPQPLPPSAPQEPSPSTPENSQYPSPSAPENPQYPSQSAPQNPQYPSPSAPQNPVFPPPSAPQNPFPEISASGNGQSSDESDSITVENEDLRARMTSQQQSETRQQESEQQSQNRQQQSEQAEEQSQQQNEEQQSEQPGPAQARSGPTPTAPQQHNPQTEARFLSRQFSSNSFNWASQSRSADEDIIPSSRSQLTEEQSQSNQQRLIELLTARGGVAEVRSGVSIEAAGEAGQIRGRVLSVTPAPPSSGPADERISTRRIVVSRPIQTLQEVNVVQPFTKLQRLSVQHPAILKTPRVDIARVKTFAPVPYTAYGGYTPYTYVH